MKQNLEYIPEMYDNFEIFHAEIFEFFFKSLKIKKLTLLDNLRQYCIAI
jgi:hypothetical protein